MRPESKLLIIAGLVFGLIFTVPISLGLPIRKIYLVGKVRPITPLNPLFYVKVFREHMQQQFVFGDEDLAYFHLTLARKRINEGLFLKSIGVEKIAKRQLWLAEKEQGIGISKLDKLSEKVDVEYLRSMQSANQLLIKELYFGV